MSRSYDAAIATIGYVLLLCCCCDVRLCVNMGYKVVCERGCADMTVHKRMSSPLGASFGVCVCVCVRVCACVPGSLRVRECVLDTSLFCARCKPADEGFRRQGFWVDAL